MKKRGIDGIDDKKKKNINIRGKENKKRKKIKEIRKKGSKKRNGKNRWKNK